MGFATCEYVFSRCFTLFCSLAVCFLLLWEAEDEISDVLLRKLGDIVLTKTQNLSKFPCHLTSEWLGDMGFPAAGQRIINTRTPLRAPTGQLALQHTSCQPPEVAPGDPPGPIGGHGQLASCAQRCRALTTSQPKLTNLKTGSYLGTDSAIFSDWSVNRPRGHAQKRSCGL